jgi:uncharacterized glyoxalase superfamily protein PhnB
MKSSPAGWPRISSSLFYDDARAAIEWLCRAFGFEVRLVVEGDKGSILHSELTYGDGVVMVSSVDSGRPTRRGKRSPRSLDGANTQALFMYVDDVDAHCNRARAAGARIVTEPKTEDYGEDYWSDRGYECHDLEGHTWYIAQRLRDPSQDSRPAKHIKEKG